MEYMITYHFFHSISFNSVAAIVVTELIYPLGWDGDKGTSILRYSEQEILQ